MAKKEIMSQIKSISSSEFEDEVLNATEPVVVDFMATWCQPCKMIAPILERLADQYEGKVKFVKLDTDQHPDIAAQYGVQKIPNLTYFKNGEVVDQAIGFLGEAEITSKVESTIAA